MGKENAAGYLTVAVAAAAAAAVGVATGHFAALLLSRQSRRRSRSGRRSIDTQRNARHHIRDLPSESSSQRSSSISSNTPTSERGATDTVKPNKEEKHDHRRCHRHRRHRRSSAHTPASSSDSPESSRCHPIESGTNERKASHRLQRPRKGPPQPLQDTQRDSHNTAAMVSRSSSSSSSYSRSPSPRAPKGVLRGVYHTKAGGIVTVYREANPYAVVAAAVERRRRSLVDHQQQQQHPRHQPSHGPLSQEEECHSPDAAAQGGGDGKATANAATTPHKSAHAARGPKTVRGSTAADMASCASVLSTLSCTVDAGDVLLRVPAHRPLSPSTALSALTAHPFSPNVAFAPPPPPSAAAAAAALPPPFSTPRRSPFSFPLVGEGAAGASALANTSLSATGVVGGVGVGASAVGLIGASASALPSTGALSGAAAAAAPLGLSATHFSTLPENPIFRIVITGGPCSGKSTGMSFLRTELERLGYAVYCVPEVATLLMTGGARLWMTSEEEHAEVAQVREHVKVQRAVRTYQSLLAHMAAEDGLLDCEGSSGALHVMAAASGELSMNTAHSVPEKVGLPSFQRRLLEHTEDCHSPLFHSSSSSSSFSSGAEGDETSPSTHSAADAGRKRTRNTPKVSAVKITMQRVVLQLMMMLEDCFYELAAIRGKPSVLLYDRGTMDGSAYCTDEEWNEILRVTGYTTEELRDTRYDAVMHFVTAAIGAESFYTLENNATRRETPAEAAAADLATRNAWRGHYLVYILDNSTGFQAKLDRALAFLCSVIGVTPTPSAMAGGMSGVGGAATSIAGGPSESPRRSSAVVTPLSLSFAGDGAAPHSVLSQPPVSGMDPQDLAYLLTGSRVMGNRASCSTGHSLSPMTPHTPQRETPTAAAVAVATAAASASADNAIAHTEATSVPPPTGVVTAEEREATALVAPLQPAGGHSTNGLALVSAFTASENSRPVTMAIAGPPERSDDGAVYDRAHDDNDDDERHVAPAEAPEKEDHPPSREERGEGLTTASYPHITTTTTTTALNAADSSTAMPSSDFPAMVSLELHGVSDLRQPAVLHDSQSLPPAMPTTAREVAGPRRSSQPQLLTSVNSKPTTMVTAAAAIVEDRSFVFADSETDDAALPEQCGAYNDSSTTPSAFPPPATRKATLACAASSTASDGSAGDPVAVAGAAAALAMARDAFKCIPPLYPLSGTAPPPTTGVAVSAAGGERRNSAEADVGQQPEHGSVETKEEEGENEDDEDTGQGPPPVRMQRRPTLPPPRSASSAPSSSMDTGGGSTDRGTTVRTASPLSPPLLIQIGISHDEDGGAGAEWAEEGARGVHDTITAATVTAPLVESSPRPPPSASPSLSPEAAGSVGVAPPSPTRYGMGSAVGSASSQGLQRYFLVKSLDPDAIPADAVTTEVTILFLRPTERKYVSEMLIRRVQVGSETAGGKRGGGRGGGGGVGARRPLYFRRVEYAAPLVTCGTAPPTPPPLADGVVTPPSGSSTEGGEVCYASHTVCTRPLSVDDFHRLAAHFDPNQPFVQKVTQSFLYTMHHFTLVRFRAPKALRGVARLVGPPDLAVQDLPPWITVDEEVSMNVLDSIM